MRRRDGEIRGKSVVSHIYISNAHLTTEGLTFVGLSLRCSSRAKVRKQCSLLEGFYEYDTILAGCVVSFPHLSDSLDNNHVDVEASQSNVIIE
jgi:hypothetical protein